MNSYPSIYNLGHKAVAELLNDPVVVEEKVDGSQFSFGLFEKEAPTLEDPLAVIPELRIKSKSADIDPNYPPALFKKAVATVIALRDKLHVGWTYRGEVLDKPKHNALAYDRTPKGNIIIFDVNDGEESYLDPAAKMQEADRLGLEVVPIFFCGNLGDASIVLQWLERTSVLGGQKIEGVVVKNYFRFGRDKKVLMGKYVSEAFKERHKLQEYGKPGKGDIVDAMIKALKTPARWDKAVQHLAEAGVLTDSPQDIGAIMQEVKADIMREEGDFIKERVFSDLIGHILRGVIRGIPEWYKAKLLDKQFENRQVEGGGTTDAG